MKVNCRENGIALLEFFLSTIAIFLLLIITYPILQDVIEQSHKAKIRENLGNITRCAEKYFLENTSNSVSLYEFIGPRKEIQAFDIIHDEVYPKIIYRSKEVSAYSEKYGMVKLY